MLHAELNIAQPPTSFSIYNNITSSAINDVSESFIMQASREDVAENEKDDASHTTVVLMVPEKKRGHVSLNGIISATSFDTGKVLDTEIMSKFCFVCHTNLISQICV
jgi:hypothetical protein